MSTQAAGPAERFTRALGALGGIAGRLGLAVSGGPDSIAMLLLAAQTCADRVAVATVDHRLRAGSLDEAEAVAALCRSRGIPHTILTGSIGLTGSRRGIQANARTYRYALLADWAREHGVSALLTAHHADDQAETVLMRLSRGAGASGLAGIRPRRLEKGVPVLRPLLGFRKSELVALVDAAGIVAADDPSNRDDRFDRTRVRRLLASADWLDPHRIAASAEAIDQADSGLRWAALRVLEERSHREGPDWIVDPADLPPELLRRMVLHILADMAGDATDPTGPSLARLLARLQGGQHATLGRVMAAPGRLWRFSPAPPHRSI